MRGLGVDIVFFFYRKHILLHIFPMQTFFTLKSSIFFSNISKAHRSVPADPFNWKFNKMLIITK